MTVPLELQVDGAEVTDLNPLPVGGTVALDGTTLAALETITAVISGAVALDATTLAALETVTAAVTGTVAVSNFPATQPVSAATLPLPTDAATESTLAARFGAVSGEPATVSAAGDTTVYTPASGMRVRLKWLGLSSPSTNTAPTTATVKWSGATGEIYRWSMGAPGAFAHGSVREGAVDESLVVNLSAAQSVFVNLDVEEIP